jgi:hypothetical protein
MTEVFFVVGSAPLKPNLRLYPFRFQTLGTFGAIVIGANVPPCSIPGFGKAIPSEEVTKRQ